MPFSGLPQQPKMQPGWIPGGDLSYGLKTSVVRVRINSNPKASTTYKHTQVAI